MEVRSGNCRTSKTCFYKKNWKFRLVSSAKDCEISDISHCVLDISNYINLFIKFQLYFESLVDFKISNSTID